MSGLRGDKDAGGVYCALYLFGCGAAFVVAAGDRALEAQDVEYVAGDERGERLKFGENVLSSFVD